MNAVSFINNTKEEIKELDELKSLMNYAAKCEDIDKAIFSVIFINDDEMKELNSKFRNIDRTTDVLSFAFEDTWDVKDSEYRMLGEIYISIDRAKEQASYFGHAYLRELSFLMIHGFLHLLGYDHMNEDDEKEMFECQEEILNGYGITR